MIDTLTTPLLILVYLVIIPISLFHPLPLFLRSSCPSVPPLPFFLCPPSLFLLSPYSLFPLSPSLPIHLFALRLNYDAPIELHRVARACQGNHVPLILYRDDPTLPPAKIQLLATKAEVRKSVRHEETAYL